MSDKYTGLCNGGPHHGKWLAHYRQAFVCIQAPSLIQLNEKPATHIGGTYIHKFGIWDWQPLSKDSEDSDK